MTDWRQSEKVFTRNFLTTKRQETQNLSTMRVWSQKKTCSTNLTWRRILLWNLNIWPRCRWTRRSTGYNLLDFSWSEWTDRHQRRFRLGINSPALVLRIKTQSNHFLWKDFLFWQQKALLLKPKEMSCWNFHCEKKTTLFNKRNKPSLRQSFCFRFPCFV